MNGYKPPYSVVNKSNTFLSIFVKSSVYCIVYEETEFFQSTNRTYAEEICEAMNMAHRAGWYDGRAFENFKNFKNLK